MQPTQTALIVPVPQAEPAVSRWRAVLDRAASCGIPAHVTVLYPFLAPHELDDGALKAVGDVVASIPPFTVGFTDVRWFGDTVVWLAPTPDDSFRALTTAVWQRFPQAPPYEGIHTDVVPHLTIGHDAPKQALIEAADAVAGFLPIRATVNTVRLIAGTPGTDGWHTIRDLPLGG